MNVQRFKKDKLNSVINFINCLGDELSEEKGEVRLSFEDEFITVEWVQGGEKHFNFIDDRHEVVKRIFLPDGQMVLAQENVNEEDVIRDWLNSRQQVEPIESLEEQVEQDLEDNSEEVGE